MAAKIEEQERIIDDLRQQLQGKNSDLLQSQHAIEEMKDSLTNYEEETERLKAAISASSNGESSMQNHLQELELLLKKTATEKQEAEREKAHLDKLVEDAEMEKEEMRERHEGEVARLTARVQELEASNAGYASASSGAEETAQEMTRLRQAVKVAEDKFEELRKKHGDLIMEKEDELSEMETIIERLKLEKQQLETQVNAFADKMQEQQEETESLKFEKEVMEQRLSAAQSRASASAGSMEQFVVVEEKEDAAEQPMADEEPMSISGYLEKGKKDLFGWSWQRRFVLVKHPYILWAAQETEIDDVHDPAQRQQFNNWEMLSGVMSVTAMDDERMFEMHVPMTRKERKEKTYRWRANTESDRNAWVKHLKPIVNRL